MKLTSSQSEAMALRRESQRLVRGFKQDALLIDYLSTHTGDISDTQLEHVLALQEQVRVLELESEVD